MDFSGLSVHVLHRSPRFLKECCKLINEEWPRGETARMMSLKASCDSLPTSLILVHNKRVLLGHCQMIRIPSIPESCFIGTVVIAKSMRGKKLGTFLMKACEKYCKNKLKLKMVYLSTEGQEMFYKKLGYVICKPISLCGTSIPNYAPRDIDSYEVSTISFCRTRNIIPPPPPPLPTPEKVITDNSFNDTYMLKYLN